MRRLQYVSSFRNEFLLPGCELLMEWQQKFEKSCWEIFLGIQICGRVIHALLVKTCSIRSHKVIDPSLRSIIRNSDYSPAGHRLADAPRRTVR